MTVMTCSLTDASSTAPLTWDAINWQKVLTHVRRLQMRIAKAHREGKHRKAKSLQWILTHSFYAKLLAVKRVVSNKGANTPGIDGKTWRTPSQKMKAAISLKRRGYQTKPLKRIYIPKKQKGKLRPLSIPVMECRAQQALHLLALEPITESMADRNAYGFRPLRSTADAIEQCFKALGFKRSAQYILEGDIHACFDEISHTFLLANAPMDKQILGKWLAAGCIDNRKFVDTTRGTPQGGIISPTLLNVTLSGLEATVKAVAKRADKVNVVIYADDFIITGATRDVLENKIKPVVETFLRERGLTLSQEKTKITKIEEGFDFLGFNVRKYKGKLIIKPAKSNVKRFLADVRGIIKQHRADSAEKLIKKLNPKIQGWSNYYRHVCSKRTFSYVDDQIFKATWQWAVRRHPNKRREWVKRKYYQQIKLRDWVFYTEVKDRNNKTSYLNLVISGNTAIKRHTKIRAEANPYDPAYHEYYEKLIAKRKIIMGNKTVPNWWMCWWRLFKPIRKHVSSHQNGFIKA